MRPPAHHPHRHRFRGLWRLHDIRRRVMGTILVSIALGAGGGWAMRTVLDASTGWWGPICVLASVWLLTMPLGWIATLRIASPVRELAKVASELQHGHLERRSELPGGQGEVGTVAVALRGMADRVARQLRDQRALMAAVSHELRSPLGRVRVLVELLREGNGPPTAYDDLQQEVDGMDALVGDLLAAARIDFEAVAPRELDVRDLCARALAQAQLPVEALVESGEPGRVRADATLLSRALLGLLDNARRYGGTRVVLRIDDLGERVQLTVEDDGPGFADGDEVRAFEPFWRGPANAPLANGAGLGLALVRQIAQAHGGEAGARNRDSGGARVWIALPRNVEA